LRQLLAWQLHGLSSNALIGETPEKVILVYHLRVSSKGQEPPAADFFSQ
jgi:hypothetical protein